MDEYLHNLASLGSTVLTILGGLTVVLSVTWTLDALDERKSPERKVVIAGALGLTIAIFMAPLAYTIQH